MTQINYLEMFIMPVPHSAGLSASIEPYSDDCQVLCAFKESFKI